MFFSAGNKRQKSELEKLFDTYQEMMFRLAMGTLHNKADAEDVVQDAFLWIIDHEERVFRIPENERTMYFSGMIRKMCLALLRKRKNHPTSAIDEVEEFEIKAEISVEEEALSKIGTDDIKAALGDLSDSDYDILYLYLFKEKSPTEISEICGISQKSIYVRLHRAKKRFIEILKKRGVV